MTDIKDVITLSFQSNDFGITVHTDAGTTWWDHLDTFMNFLRGMGYHIEEGSWVSGNPAAPELDPPYKKDLEAKDKMITNLLEAIVVLSAKLDSVSEERTCMMKVLSGISVGSDGKNHLTKEDAGQTKCSWRTTAAFGDDELLGDEENIPVDSISDSEYSITHEKKVKKKATKKKAIKKRSK